MQTSHRKTQRLNSGGPRERSRNLKQAIYKQLREQIVFLGS